MSTETTIEVPAERYESALPDDYSEESVEIGISAFSDSVYVKFPRFGRSGTNDYCVKAIPLFKSVVDVRTEWKGKDLWTGPKLTRYGALQKRRGDASFIGDDKVSHRILDPTDCDPVHVELVGEFATTVGDVQEDDYWRGYRNGAHSEGDEMLGWDEIAWRCFDKRWSGNEDLLLDAGKWLAREGMVPCNRTNALFPIPEWSTPTGSYVATISSLVGGGCPNCGADKDEHWECIKSSNRTRVPNKYQCQECGHTKEGITTG